jgi:hypothetical protein
MKYNNATVRVLSPVAATTSTSTTATIKKHQQKRGTTVWPNRITVFFFNEKRMKILSSNYGHIL